MKENNLKYIIKDRKILKPVDQIVEKDIEIYKVNKEIDADLEKFQKELDAKEKESQSIRDKLKIEFATENYDKHKENFEYSQTFVRTIPYNAKDYNNNKEDYIRYCSKKQKEAADGLELCDKILRNLGSEFINKNELPFD